MRVSTDGLVQTGTVCGPDKLVEFVVEDFAIGIVRRMSGITRPDKLVEFVGRFWQMVSFVK